MFGFFKVSEDLFYKELLSDDIDINKIQKYIEKGIDKDRYYKLFEKVCLAKEGLDSVSTKYNEKKTNQNLLYYNRQVF